MSHPPAADASPADEGAGHTPLKRFEAFAASLDAEADRCGPQAASRMLETGAPYRCDLAQTFAGATLEAVQTVGCARQAVLQQSRLKTRGDADVARMMRLRIGG